VTSLSLQPPLLIAEVSQFLYYGTLVHPDSQQPPRIRPGGTSNRGLCTTAEALVTTLSLRQRAKTAVLDQLFVPGTKDSILDIGAMATIIEGTQGTGARVRLVGVTGTGVDAELVDVIFPVRTATDELYAIDTTGSQAGSTLLVERTKDTTLSLAVLFKAKFKVDFAVGTEEDPLLTSMNNMTRRSYYDY
jgi:hypothetical protein